MKFSPTRGHIIVKEIDAPKASPGGIVLPDTRQKDVILRGKILAVGADAYSADGSKQIPMSVHEGDEVFFRVYDANKIEIEGEEYYIMQERAIIGMLLGGYQDETH